MRPGRRGLRPGRRPEASGQVSLRVALASGWVTLPRAVLVRSFFERGTRVEKEFRAAETALSAALHAIRLVSSSRADAPGSARPAAGPTAGGLRPGLAARRPGLRLGRRSRERFSFARSSNEELALRWCSALPRARSRQRCTQSGSFLRAGPTAGAFGSGRPLADPFAPREWRFSFARSSNEELAG